MTSNAVYPGLLVAVATLGRLIPIIIAWPYPLGFDTNAIYLPAMIEGPPGLYEIFKQAHLNQFILWLVYATYPHPFEILNAFAIIFQGALTLAVYFYARNVVKLSKEFSFVTGLVFTFNILTFRLTWDQYRMSLALILAMLAWVCLASKSQVRKFLAIPLSVLVVLSNPLPAALFLAALTIHLIFSRSDGVRNLMAEILAVLIGVLLFVPQNFWTSSSNNVLTIQTGIPIGSFTAITGALASLSGLSYLFFTSWPLLLLLPFVIRKVKSDYHWIWLFCVFACALLGPFVGLGVFPVWIYWMIGFPLSILFGLALEYNSKNRLVKYLAVGSILISLLMMLFYVTTFSVTPNPYYMETIGTNNYTPVGYLQSTVDITYERQLLILLNESMNLVPRNSTIFLPAQFYGLALTLPVHNEVNLTNIGEIDPTFSSTNFSQIESYVGSYTLWLTRPDGWYGVNVMPSNFVLSINGGEFSLYYIGAQ